MKIKTDQFLYSHYRVRVSIHCDYALALNLIPFTANQFWIMSHTFPLRIIGCVIAIIRNIHQVKMIC